MDLCVRVNQCRWPGCSPSFPIKDVLIYQQWFPDDDGLNFHSEDWLFTASVKGWANDEVALLWLQRPFIPHTQPDDSEEWRLLVLDGHGRQCSTACRHIPPTSCSPRRRLVRRAEKEFSQGARSAFLDCTGHLRYEVLLLMGLNKGREAAFTKKLIERG